MAASQVVLYFDRQEDALLFTLAASSVISAEASGRADEALAKIAKEICKASRIKTEGVLNSFFFFKQKTAYEISNLLSFQLKPTRFRSMFLVLISLTCMPPRARHGKSLIIMHFN